MEQILTKASKISLTQLLSQLDISDLNIYKQAYLEMSSPFIETKQQHEKTQFEFGVSFELSGQMKGRVYCFIDTYKKEFKTRDTNFFKALFAESMNILTGHILTQIFNSSGISLKLSSPKFIDLKDQNVIKKSHWNQFVSAGYKLITGIDEYDCRIIFEINKEHI